MPYPIESFFNIEKYGCSFFLIVWASNEVVCEMNELVCGCTSVSECALFFADLWVCCGFKFKENYFSKNFESDERTAIDHNFQVVSGLHRVLIVMITASFQLNEKWLRRGQPLKIFIRKRIVLYGTFLRAVLVMGSASGALWFGRFLMRNSIVPGVVKSVFRVVEFLIYVRLLFTSVRSETWFWLTWLL